MSNDRAVATTSCPSAVVYKMLATWQEKASKSAVSRTFLPYNIGSSEVTELNIMSASGQSTWRQEQGNWVGISDKATADGSRRTDTY